MGVGMQRSRELLMVATEGLSVDERVKAVMEVEAAQANEGRLGISHYLTGLFVT